MVAGMTCGHCAAAVRAEISRLPGVTEVDVDVASGEVRIAAEAVPDGAALRAAIDPRLRVGHGHDRRAHGDRAPHLDGRRRRRPRPHAGEHRPAGCRGAARPEAAGGSVAAARTLLPAGLVGENDPLAAPDGQAHSSSGTSRARLL
ncbi:MAG TPA: heavy-metal-associated domain-containing protein [Streptosporangiaceae bacterium]|nr:heavy-metal-associated domain-containing protein [Streptosporangiaceae bacterium]